MSNENAQEFEERDGKHHSLHPTLPNIKV